MPGRGFAESSDRAQTRRKRASTFGVDRKVYSPTECNCAEQGMTNF
jgi:hypothetical protein